MKIKNRRPLIVGGIIVLLGLLGWLVSRVGDVGVRRDLVEERPLQVQNPLVPGVPFSVTWEVEPDEADRSVLLKLRTTGGVETELAAARFTGKAINAEVPCEVAGGDGSLLLTELISGKVLAQSAVSILSPGPDCF